MPSVFFRANEEPAGRPNFSRILFKNMEDAVDSGARSAGESLTAAESVKSPAGAESE
jgi:hypothetical protein